MHVCIFITPLSLAVSICMAFLETYVSISISCSSCFSINIGDNLSFCFTLYLSFFLRTPIYLCLSFKLPLSLSHYLCLSFKLPLSLYLITSVFHSNYRCISLSNYLCLSFKLSLSLFQTTSVSLSHYNCN